MKSLKKVSSIPLDSEVSKVIDSFNTGDNKHTNAPSINAVKNYCKTALKIETVTQSLPSVLPGAFTESIIIDDIQDYEPISVSGFISSRDDILVRGWGIVDTIAGTKAIRLYLINESSSSVSFTYTVGALLVNKNFFSSEE